MTAPRDTAVQDRDAKGSCVSPEGRILAMVARGIPLSQVLDGLCRVVEEQVPGVLASVLLLDGDRLRHGGAPSLPKAYTEAIDGAVIGPTAGPCGMAASRGQQVIVSDLASDPLWADFREVALPHSLRACWSTPIFSANGNVMATFAMYFPEPRSPSPRDHHIVERITPLAGIAIQRKLDEDKLRDSEDRWRAVFENNPIMSFMLDVAGTVVSVNPSGAEQLGYTVDELIGRSLLDLFDETDRDAVQTQVAACVGGVGHARSWELRTVRKDGTRIYVRETARAIRRTGREPAVLVVCEDITERRRAEDALHRAQAELAHVTRLTTLGQLAASIAHEVNQPLAAIVADANASLNWLAAAEPELERVRQTLLAIATDGHRAADVIQRIRQLATKTEPGKARLDVHDIVRDVVAFVRAEVARYEITLTLDTAPPLPSVVGDRVQLQQVVLNLVMNAIEAMASVTGRPRELVIRCERHDADVVRVAVHDTGVGIRTSDLDRVFSAFFTTKPGGMGMGLSISRSIIEAHGGRLWAVPNEPHGAIFQFSLPVA